MKNSSSTKRSLIHRRDFIKQTTFLTSSAIFMSSALDLGIKKKYKMGLQLFTMRSDMAKDAIGSLKKNCRDRL